MTLVLAASIYLRDRPAETVPAEASATDFLSLLSEPVDGFARIDPGRPLRFPEDHAAHPEQRTEAWLLSGVFSDPAGRQEAVQLTIIRVGLTPSRSPSESAWATTDAYAGLLALSDADAGGVKVAERYSRGAAGLAGFRSEPLEVWLEDWRLGFDQDHEQLHVTVDAAARDTKLRLTLQGVERPSAAAGGEGASPASDAPFAIYQLAALDAEGELRRGTQVVPVTGRFVLEHAWGELPPPGGPVANDRFTLFLEDGRVVTLLRTHRVDGSGRPATSGILTAPDGSATELSRDSVRLEPEEYWRDTEAGARYPTHWLFESRDPGLRLRLVPERVEQGGRAWQPFWLGPMRVEDDGGTPVGTGFAVLNGYEETT